MRADLQSACRHREVEMYKVPGSAAYRPLRRWRCALCGRPVTEEYARKMIRRTMRRSPSRA